MSGFAADAVDWALGMTALTTLIFCVARIAERALAGRVSARVRMALYLAVAARLLLPLRWSGGFHVVGWAVADATNVSRAIAPLSPSAAAHFVETASGTALPWPLMLALGAYVAGVAALLVGRGLARRGLSTGLRPARPSLAVMSNRAPVFESDDVGPAVVGVIRPRVVVPSWLADSLDADALRWIVRHETAHVDARDPLLLAAAQSVAIALWPIAPLWLALRRVRALMEVACDERTLVGASDTERSQFMRVQACVATMQTRRVSVLGAPGFGDDLGERLRALTSAARRWPRLAQGAVVAGVAAGLVACASSAVPRESAPSPRESKPSIPGTDYMLVRVVPVSEPTRDADEVREHVIETSLMTAQGGEPMVLRSVGSIRCSGTGSVKSIFPQLIVGDDLRIEGLRAVMAPRLVARDGERASIFVGESETLDRVSGAPTKSFTGFRSEFTVTPADAGAIDLELSFEHRAGGALVSEIPLTTIRLRLGESALIGTRRPDVAPR